MIYQCILLFQGTPFNCEISFVTTHIKNRNYYLRKCCTSCGKITATLISKYCAQKIFLLLSLLLLLLLLCYYRHYFVISRFTFCVTLCKSILIMAFKHLFHKVTYLKLKLQYCKYFKY